MALFQRRVNEKSNLPSYTISSTKTKLVVGLGNKGKEYKNTRHNIGFEAVDFFAASNDFPAWISKKDLKCELAITNLGDVRVILCKPQTFMNASGEAVQAVQRFFRIYNGSTLAVYDELAIPFGQLRTRVGGSDAGHNGVKSLIAHLGDDFARLRIGIGSEVSGKADAADFVLGKFSKAEQAKIPLILREANSLINEFVVSSQMMAETRTII